MRKIEIILDANSPSSNVFTFTEFETQILIDIKRNPDRSPLAYTLANDRDHLVRNGTGNLQFVRLGRSHYDTIKLDAALGSSSTVKALLYIGTWGEILTCDLHYHLDQFNQSASETTMSFYIGLPNATNLFVRTDSRGNFTIVRTLTISPTQVYTQQETIDTGSETATHLTQIYNRIVANQNNNLFMEDQQKNIKTMQNKVFNFLSVY